MILSKMEMKKELAQMLDGTVALLCGSKDPDDVRAYRKAWNDWLTEQPFRTRWANIVRCHDDFVDHLKAAVLAAGFEMEGTLAAGFEME